MSAKVLEKKVTLQVPIVVGSEEIRELTIKRPKGKHLRALPMDPDIGDFLNLAGKLAGHPPSVMDELDVDDVQAVADAVESFLGNGQKTGASG